MIYEKQIGGNVMYNSAKELIENEIDYELKKQIYYSISNGVEIFKELKIGNIEIFDNELSSNILSRIMTFCIDRQFSPDIYVNKNGFESNIKTVNVFNYKVAELRNNNMVIHIAKTTKGRNLPSKSVYKLKYAQNNNFKQQQLKLDLVGNTNKVTIEPYYGIITYNVDQNLEIKAINLIIPASDMETYIEKIDIKSEVERLKTVQNDIQNEKTLITLKNEFNKSKIINKKQVNYNEN